jgi:hypothetical protein
VICAIVGSVIRIYNAALVAVEMTPQFVTYVSMQVMAGIYWAVM